MSSHPFTKYFRRHHRAPRIRIRAGYQTICVEFHPGYVHFYAYPGKGELYIPRSAFFQLLKSMMPFIKILRRYPTGDFDVAERMNESFLFEMKILEEKRAAKKVREWDHDASERQRKRYLAAKRRASGQKSQGKSRKHRKRRK